MVFRALFLFEVQFQKRSYLRGGNSSWRVIRRNKTEHFKTIKKIHHGCLKMQKRVAAWQHSANSKLKKKFAKTLISSGSYQRKYKNKGFRELRLFSTDLAYCSTVSFQRKA